MDEPLTWLARRVAFGRPVDRLVELVGSEPAHAIGVLTRPDDHAVARGPDPWEDLDLGGLDDRAVRTAGPVVVDRWLDHMAATPRPLEEWMTWFWYDHFGVAYRVVRDLLPLVRHFRLLRRHALGNFRELVRDVTVDAAMLDFLDGGVSTGSAPNENYARELLELYTIGIGNYGEDDVAAAARALTGWVVRRPREWEVTFIAFRHDDRPNRLLGVDGVHDLDTVVDAVTSHPACAPFVAGKLARTVLGDEVSEEAIGRYAAVFTDSGLELAPLLASILSDGVAGSWSPLVDEPVRWLMTVEQAVGARLAAADRLRYLQVAGQVPGNCPSVNGYPGELVWLGASATIGRFNAAHQLAQVAADGSPALGAAVVGDLDALATALLRPVGFEPATRAALAPLAGRDLLAAALACPEMIVT